MTRCLKKLFNVYIRCVIAYIRTQSSSLHYWCILHAAPLVCLVAFSTRCSILLTKHRNYVYTYSAGAFWTHQLKRRVNVHFTKMKIKNINVESGSKQQHIRSLNIQFCWHIEWGKWIEKFVMRACSSLIEVLFYWDWLEASLWMI